MWQSFGLGSVLAMKVIVAGSRDFKDYALLKEFLDKLVIFRSDFAEIVSGTASGADKLGERYAQEHNLAIKRFPADWEKYGKAAGHIRNRQMAKYADACVVFWDGQSKGSANMAKVARELKLPLVVVNYKVRKYRMVNVDGFKQSD